MRLIIILPLLLLFLSGCVNDTITPNQDIEVTTENGSRKIRAVISDVSKGEYCFTDHYNMEDMIKLKLNAESEIKIFDVTYSGDKVAHGYTVTIE